MFGAGRGLGKLRVGGDICERGKGRKGFCGLGGV